MAMHLNITEDKIIGIVYQATNKTNSKQYVGITARSLKDRITGHVSSAKRGTRNNTSIQAPIWGNSIATFEFKVIYQAKDMDDFQEKERYFIDDLREHLRLPYTFPSSALNGIWVSSILY